jgi:phage shock protein C
MRGNRQGFAVDRQQGKFLGVCAGIANHSGIDVTIVRIALVLVTLLGAFPWTVIAYFAAALVGSRAGGERSRRRIPSREESRERKRNLDLRMQAIETCVTSSNSRLAREIEDLR